MVKIGFLAALGAISGQGAAPAPQTFCQRMAPQLGMTPIERGQQGAASGEWRANQLGGVKNLLLGGSTMVSFSVQPVGVVTEQAEVDRLQKMCAQEKKSVICRMEGPARLVVGASKATATIEARPGERAEVEMRGTTVYCRGPAAIRTR
ncbi:hypothetical protein SAMN06297144_1769 [Sphingomonas guangdongensis]|uniref:Uncharacterized protein n=1 Tax=Sphingomonas guangdongensis TaxID=1141890 RepID=A0A285QXV8_9SPHN|nr:hypothetical protein [Sphingomonas guangdongensis]SOB86661.1 hypothetical protein SAMN06297144_1769 [Sphingomonas guangdongensis]